jgi:zinc transport system substrate-binding protein
MRNTLLAATVSTLALSSAACADVPSVAVDIPPVHSLVSMVMEGVGSPELIVQQGASPHGYSLRPAEAKTLQDADIVFWVSKGLEPWLERSIDSLAADAKSIELMETEGTTELEFREGATFEKHSHDHDDEDHDGEEHDHDHEAHGDHDHGEEEHAAREGHDHDHDEEEEHAHEGHDHGEGEEHAHDDHGHDHHGHDPHAWLDPENARVWLDVIAADLSALDPDNASTYAANAAEGKAELAALIDEIDADMEAVRGQNFIVFHDAYQYFENRFGIAAAGSIRVSDASDPSPARIDEIRSKVAELNVTCAFSEPQFNPGLVQTVFEGTDATIGVLDPLGSDLTLGPDLYPQMIRNLANSYTNCF